MKKIAEKLKEYGKIKVCRAFSGAYYSEEEDAIYIPEPKEFENYAKYLRVLTHELIHSTGHQSRLGRNLKMSKLTFEYAMEELIAETGVKEVAKKLGFYKEIKKESEEYFNRWFYYASFFECEKVILKKSSKKGEEASNYILKNIL